MSAAFDTVDHKILLRRLEESFGVHGQALQWLSSFLTDRTQAIAFAGSISTPQMLVCGVVSHRDPYWVPCCSSSILQMY